MNNKQFSHSTFPLFCTLVCSYRLRDRLTQEVETLHVASTHWCLGYRPYLNGLSGLRDRLQGLECLGCIIISINRNHIKITIATSESTRKRGTSNYSFCFSCFRFLSGFLSCFASCCLFVSSCKEVWTSDAFSLFCCWFVILTSRSAFCDTIEEQMQVTRTHLKLNYYVYFDSS